MRTMSSKGLAFLTKEEGFKARMYRDPAGLPTIGVGHLLTRDELTSGRIEVSPGRVVRWTEGLSEDDVIALLTKDVEWAEDAVNSIFRQATEKMGYPVEVDQAQFDMLVSLVYNIGAGAWRSSTLARRILAGRLQDVPEQMLRWKYSAGVPILAARRAREVEVYKEGYA